MTNTEYARLSGNKKFKGKIVFSISYNEEISTIARLGLLSDWLDQLIEEVELQMELFENQMKYSEKKEISKSDFNILTEKLNTKLYEISVK